MNRYFPFAIFLSSALFISAFGQTQYIERSSRSGGVGGFVNSAKTVRRANRQPSRGSAMRNFAAPAGVITSENILSGAVDVNVHSISDRTIRLGLAPGGVTIVEFPANDFIYARHPGDENFVTIDDSLKTRSNPSDPLIFRPGKGFFIPSAKNKQTPYGQITVQMVSGAVFTFQIYPVKSLNQSASRVQVLYSPEEIISERKRLGLPVNLNIPRELPVPEDTSTTSAPKKNSPEVIAENTADSAAEKLNQLPDQIQSTPQSRVAELGKKIVSRGGSYKWSFGAPVHGLSIAAQPTLVFEEGAYRIDFIAVKNTLSAPISLVNLPNLLIATYDPKGDKKSAVNQEILPAEFVFHDLPESAIIESNGVAYFALVTKYPVILGANQDLRLGVAQTNAADEPVFLNLVTKAR